MAEDKLVNQGNNDWMEDYEGQLAIDVFQDDENVIIKAPVAGVSREDIELTISNEVVTIKGERKHESEIQRENYLCQECYWGSFSRSYVLPVEVQGDKATASLKKNGILTITIPKQNQAKSKAIDIKAEE